MGRNNPDTRRSFYKACLWITFKVSLSGRSPTHSFPRKANLTNEATEYVLDTQTQMRNWSKNWFNLLVGERFGHAVINNIEMKPVRPLVKERNSFKYRHLIKNLRGNNTTWKISAEFKRPTLPATHYNLWVTSS